MSRTTGKQKTGFITRRTSPAVLTDGFDEILHLIQSARLRAVSALNTGLIDLYWSIGRHISAKVAEDGWGQGTVAALAQYIHRQAPNVRGFSTSNLWRMAQFFEAYRERPQLAPLVRELPWTHNLLILSGCKREEEMEFYLRLCIQEQWSKRKS